MSVAQLQLGVEVLKGFFWRNRTMFQFFSFPTEGVSIAQFQTGPDIFIRTCSCK